ncbi:MAG: sigma-54 dependent transcriptional regulator [Pseudomonadales bacterium]|jgi:DNA-binding NtrC family response regulator|nr:sigma-54 dependent transcriptional regulator [Pseudomonadales bacterium]
MSHLLIVEDEDIIRSALRRLLERNGYQVSEARSVQEASDHHDLDTFDVIISDLRLPGAPGTDLIKRTATPVLIMTSYASLRSAIDSMKIGAVDYISKPFEHDEILSAITRVIGDDSKTRNLSRRHPRPNEVPVTGMVGSCPQMLELFRRIRKVAQTNSSVLIQGESGTGKELVARAVHEASSRRESNLISVNCAAIPENLIESELFGHEKGAFTGATATRTGLVEAANNGTLFLDEIGELPLDAQARLLRVLQEHEIRKVGSVLSQKVDVRLVAATHRDLKQFVREGRFREDLFYRINVMPLHLPPLRERGNDILELAERILAHTCKRLGMDAMRFSADAIQAITTYPWPGNVRELENAIERAVILTEEPLIAMELLGLDVELVKIDGKHAYRSPTAQTQESAALRIDDDPAEDLSLEDYFQRFVLEHQEQMNETELAKKLGISRKCLWERRQRFDIPRRKRSA